MALNSDVSSLSITMNPNSGVSSLSSTSTSSSDRPIHNQKYIDTYISEKKKLSQPRLGNMPNLHVAIVHNNDLVTPLEYSAQDLCYVLQRHKNLDIKAYFHPNHTICKEVHAEMNIKNVTADDSSCPKTILLRALQNSALSGGDKISSNGYCQKVKNIVSYIRCQCSQIYEEATTKDGTYCQDQYVNN